MIDSAKVQMSSKIRLLHPYAYPGALLLVFSYFLQTHFKIKIQEILILLQFKNQNAAACVGSTNYLFVLVWFLVILLLLKKYTDH